jgi:glycerol-3-phosphate dehydrogenase (NAD(P)+)
MNLYTSDHPKEIVIVGNGVWGNALFAVIHTHHPHVKMWDRKFNLNTAQLLILAIPTIAIRDVLSKVELNPECILVNTSKGVEKDTHLLPYQIVKKMARKNHYFTLIGPSFAKEVTENIPTIVNIGYKNSKYAEYIKNIFQTNAFHVRLTKDVEVIELFAAFKNVYAIAAGIAHGIGLKANTHAKLTVLALEELYRMMRNLKLSISSRSLAGTVGDLVLTTYSEESRNYRFGEALVQYSSEDALKRVASTVEGYNTAFSVHALAHKYGVHLPLAELVYDIIVTNNPENTKSKFTKFLEEV